MGALPGKRDNFSPCEQKNYLTCQNVFSLTEKGPLKVKPKVAELEGTTVQDVNLEHSVQSTKSEKLNLKVQKTLGTVACCIISCNLQRCSTLERCKIGKYAFSLHFANIFYTNQTFFLN